MAAIGAVFPNAALDGMRRRRTFGDGAMLPTVTCRASSGDEILDALRTDFGRIAHAFRMRCGSRILGEGRRAERAVGAGGGQLHSG